MSRRDMLILGNRIQGDKTTALANVERAFLEDDEFREDKELVAAAFQFVSDILKKGASPQLLAQAASCVGAMAHTVPKRRDQFVERGVIPCLLAMCAPRKGDVPEHNLLLHQFGTYALEKLTTRYPVAQHELVEDNGIAILIGLTKSHRLSDEHVDCCQIRRCGVGVDSLSQCDSGAQNALQKLVLNATLRAKVYRLFGDRAVRCQLSCGDARASASAPAFCVDIVGSGGRQSISDRLADQAQVWSAPNDSGVDGKSPSATVPIHVQRVMADGAHFWATVNASGGHGDELFAGMDPSQEFACCLKDVLPNQPERMSLLRNTLGILAQLCQHRKSYCSAISEHVDHLRSLYLLPDLSLCSNVLTCVYHMAALPQAAHEMACMDILEDILDLCQRGLPCLPDSSTLLYVCGMCIHLIVSHCTKCRYQLCQLSNWPVLAQAAQLLAERSRPVFIAILKIVVGKEDTATFAPSIDPVSPSGPDSSQETSPVNTRRRSNAGNAACDWTGSSPPAQSRTRQHSGAQPRRRGSQEFNNSGESHGNSPPRPSDTPPGRRQSHSNSGSPSTQGNLTTGEVCPVCHSPATQRSGLSTSENEPSTSNGRRHPGAAERSDARSHGDLRTSRTVHFSPPTQSGAQDDGGCRGSAVATVGEPSLDTSPSSPGIGRSRDDGRGYHDNRHEDGSHSDRSPGVAARTGRRGQADSGSDRSPVLDRGGKRVSDGRPPTTEPMHHHHGDTVESGDTFQVQHFVRSHADGSVDDGFACISSNDKKSGTEFPATDVRFYNEGEVVSEPIMVALPAQYSSQSVAGDDWKRRIDEMSDDIVAGESVDRKVMFDDDRFYTVGSRVQFRCDATHELRAIDAMSSKAYREIMQRTVCAFLNGGSGGTLYFGINQTGLITGVSWTRRMRDEFRLIVDQMMHRFKPVVSSDLFSVNFVMCVDGTMSRSGTMRQAMENVFVVEVTVRTTMGGIFVTGGDQCFLRTGSTSKRLTMEDVRQLAAEEQEKRYQEEIRSLHAELEVIRCLHAHTLSGDIVTEPVLSSGPVKPAWDPFGPGTVADSAF